MTYHVNIHMPSNVGRIDDLSADQFVAKTNKNGAVKTIDLYYRPSATPKNNSERFTQKLENFVQRLKGYKPAIKSKSLTDAFKNINANPTIGRNFNVNLIPTTMKEVLNTEKGEISKKGTTVTVQGWTDALDTENLLDELNRR